MSPNVYGIIGALVGGYVLGWKHHEHRHRLHRRATEPELRTAFQDGFAEGVQRTFHRFDRVRAAGMTSPESQHLTPPPRLPQTQADALPNTPEPPTQ